MPQLHKLFNSHMAPRRPFLAFGAAVSSIPFLGNTSQAVEAPKFSDNPFSLGVASGDPDHRGVVIWTRLAPEPLTPNGGMPAASVRVGWEVAEDEGRKKIVAKGNPLATPQIGH